MCPESFFQISVTGIPGPAVGQEEIQVYLILFPSIGLDDRTEFYGSFSPFTLGEKPGPWEGLVLSVLGSRQPIFWDQGPFCGWVAFTRPAALSSPPSAVPLLCLAPLSPALWPLEEVAIAPCIPQIAHFLGEP